MPTLEQLSDPAYMLNLSLHSILPYLGLPIGEFFDLDALAQHCAASGNWYCLLTTAPMPLPGGVGTSANAIAVC